MKRKKSKPKEKLVFLKEKNSGLVRFFIYAIFSLLFYVLMIEPVFPEQIYVKEGDISTETILSPVTKVDVYATKKAREEAMTSIGSQYTRDEQLTNKQLERIDRIFVEIERINADTSLKENEKIASLKELISKELPPDFYLKLVRTPEDNLPAIKKTTKSIVSSIMGEGVRKENLQSKKDSVDKMLVTSTMDSNSRYIVRQLARSSILVNETYDAEKTKSIREAAADAVEPIAIKKGEVIVTQGQEITAEHIRKIKEVGLMREHRDVSPYFGLLILTSLIFIGIYLFIHRFEPDFHKNTNKLLLLFSINLLTLLVMKVITYMENLEWANIGYLAPVVLAAMLSVLLLNRRVAIASVFILSIISSMLYSSGTEFLFDFRYGFVSLVSGLTAIYALSKAQKTSAILGAGFFSALSSSVAILGVYCLIPSEGGIISLIQSLGFGMLSGIISAILTIGIMPYFESIFSILSPMKLIELSNPNHPLLQKLLYETPGTYHHSVIVGNLSEAAAEAIGADGLLARVGAYYHDVGKIKRPQFFIENQINQENPHDKISPNLSKTIIISHTKDGVEMLKEYRIPKEIQDIAAQHHGTTLLKYFYYKAKEQAGSEQLTEEDFRYPGPKAQFKEAAIVGICDSVEAAVRSMQRPTPARIEALVQKIVQERLEDGQFDACDLTLKELGLIQKAICATLHGMFHTRIEYPDETTVKGAKTG